jgi:phage tail-like protein
VQRNGPSGKKESVTITLRDEAGQDVQTWRLIKVIPLKYTGPTLAAKGGGEVATEELMLAAEGFEIG